MGIAKKTEKRTKKTQKSTKKGLFSSIKSKFSSLLITSIVISIVLSIYVILPGVSRNITSLTTYYMSDMTSAYGRILDQNINISVMYLYVDRLEALLGGVGIEGMDSSYFYVVASDGTILYHPTTEKIGKPAENSIVSDVVEQLAAGKIPKSKVEPYDYHGTSKTCSYYVAGEGKAILVLTVDEKEILEPIATALTQAIIAGVIITLVMGVIGYIISARMTKPILQVTNTINRLANMNFTEDSQTLKISRRRDESGSIARAITTLRESLVNVVSDIKKQSTQLYDTSAQLTGSARTTSSTVQNVERAVSEIATGATSQAQETQKATEDIILMGTMVEDTNSQVSILHTAADSDRKSVV